MVVSLKTDLRFPIPGQQGHGSRIIHYLLFMNILTIRMPYQYRDEIRFANLALISSRQIAIHASMMAIFLVSIT